MARISEVTIVMDGEKINGFTAFKEHQIETSQVVEMADGYDVVDVPEQYGFDLSISPEKGADREWLSIGKNKPATCIVQYTGGKKVVYGGVKCLSMEPSENNGKDQKVYALVFFAKTRKVS